MRQREEDDHINDFGRNPLGESKQESVSEFITKIIHQPYGLWISCDIAVWTEL